MQDLENGGLCKSQPCDLVRYFPGILFCHIFVVRHFLVKEGKEAYNC